MTQPHTSAPAIILIEPQMGENIGACARAMLNCGLTDLRLVRPRDGWPNDRADTMSSGALSKMPPAQVFETTQDAIADCRFVYATTARPRDMVKNVFTAKGAAEDVQARAGQKSAVLFGPERAGLDNDDVALSNAVITIPLNPDFSSLNLAQGVLVVAYEWYQLQQDAPKKQLLAGNSAPASREDLDGFLERLETELDTAGFFKTPEVKPSTVRNLKSMLTRADMTDQEIRTFHGIISALIGKK